MMRRLLLITSVFALLVAYTAVDAHAARQRGSWRGSSAARPSEARSVIKPTDYPRVRQIDGKTLWDLGKQKGQWPTLP